MMQGFNKKKKGRTLCYAALLAAMTMSLSACGGADEDPTDSNIQTESDAQGGAAVGSEATDPVEKEQTEESEQTEATETVSQTEDMPETEEPQDTSDSEDIPHIAAEGEIVTYEGIVVLDGSAYELYSYKEDMAKAYTDSINTFAQAVLGKADVYDIVIPLSSEIMFPDNRKGEISSANQKKANDNILGMLSDDVKAVNIYDTLMAHRDEYLYFRTDHHWTALGAYYSYVEFCKAKGIEPEALESYETKVFDDFLGSFYRDTEDPSIAETPDEITAYLPHASAKLHITPAEGDEFDWPVIADVTNYTKRLKYCTFIGGDNPYSVITNKDLSDGSACIVVKESFGNAFVPFLIDHYQYVYVIDYRYWKGSLEELVGETGAKDVIFINNLSMIRNKYLVGQLKKVM